MGILDRIWPQEEKKENFLDGVLAKVGEKTEELRENIEDNKFVQFAILTSTWTDTHSIILGSTCLASFTLGFGLGRVKPFWRRLMDVHQIPRVGADTPFLRGHVLSVSDGDTFRFYHTPTMFHSTKPQAKISEVALPIRICTIDTPETAKFGKPGQPYGDDAKKHLEGMILNQTVHIRLLQKDQYGRAVAQVARKGMFRTKWMDEEMLKAGLAEVYLGGGAVYGRRGKDNYLDLMEKAKSKRKGMWAQSNRESAAEFKARMKNREK